VGWICSRKITYRLGLLLTRVAALKIVSLSGSQKIRLVSVDHHIGILLHISVYTQGSLKVDITWDGEKVRG